ncbi:MAG: two-component regulator propeller domain-containing protein [Calditrichaceae bacterium]
MKYLSLFFLLITVAWADDLRDWETITNMNDVRDLAIDQEIVWAATTGGVYSYGKTDNQIRRFTNVDGMYSIDMRAITLDNYGNAITGGEDGVIQIYNQSSDQWSQLFQISGNEISDILSKEDTLWVAAGKSVSVFLWNGSIYKYKDSFVNFPILPGKTTSLQIFSGRVWLGTESGLLTAPSDFSKNTINDPALWKVFNTSNGLKSDYIHDMIVYDDKIWVGTNAGLVSLDSSMQLHEETAWGENAVHTLAKSDQNIYASYFGSYYSYSAGNGRQLIGSFQNIISAMQMDSSGIIRIGLRFGGLFSTGWDKPLLLDGPVSNTLRYVITDSRGNIWVSTGKFKLYSGEGFSFYNGNSWTSVDFTGSELARLGNTDVIYEDQNGNIWTGTWGGGVVVMRNEELLFFNDYYTDGFVKINAGDSTYEMSIQPIPAEYRGFFSPAQVSAPNYQVITAIKEDLSGNLWFGNYYASNGNILAVAPYSADGFVDLNKENWTYFGADDGIIADEQGISCIEFDDFGRVWFGTLNNGVYILDYNNTLRNKNDDRLYKLNIDDNLYSNSVLSVAADKDGIVWIGTTAGLNSFDGVNVYKHVGDLEGLSGPLENRINYIFVDTYNNKWFATQGGLSILKDGRSAWDSMAWVGYTTLNSGLVNNDVHGVYVDPVDSRTIIATEHGLSVFRGSFAEIQNSYSQMNAGPNPFVIDGSNRNFVITELKYSSTVNIYNLNGVLVRELTSQNNQVFGSRASWDGRDENGDPVASGIYFYLAYHEDGTSASGKIAVIRK